MMRPLLALLFVFVLGVPGAFAAEDVDYDRLVRWMEGTFSSAEHARRDTAFMDMTLHVKRIWPDRRDGAWFYVELSRVDAEDKPERQMVYQVMRVEEGMIESIVWSVRNPDAVRGAWADSTIFEERSQKDLVRRRGCELYFQTDADRYVGGTHGMACASDIKGVSYMTSTITVMADGIMIWERGYSPTNEQLFGSKKQGYVFLRK
ncbi:MAG: chromophore lyase CpcT/CpeT ['Candidatus Kapabacteria' thiocyanatum]|uniref:Chromophore lyase CpcT/CpeT n=1 Tax=Candidatus Kapaibacterium thiocyanatum TaxID=1895771 RepID=A0A1M3KY54_9BACT|nr:chromophore lyase CpcT/CpeT ['Candidatus Kapabacteria' thiocyanatum]OJX57184.1 MAG: hypothetical protein BGO89_11835 ['Candidatus Kapabacteria' thiocyanatum]